MAHSRYIEFSLCVVAFSLVMTSQPFTQSQATSRRRDFVWSSKMVGGERVAVVSVRLDDEDERGRRSLPLTGDEDPFRKTITREDSEGGGEGATESHHHHHHHTHRHHHGDRGREESHAERISLNDVQPLEERIRSPTTPLKEVLAATGLDINSSIFANLTTTSVPARRGRRGRRKQRSGRKGNKVKRDKKRRSKGNRRRKEGKNRRRRPKNNPNSRRCRELKGRRKRRCREEAEASEEKDMFSFITNIHDRPFVVAVSGSEACQYHNLAQCARQVGLPSSDPETLILVVKCRFREEFLKCMEEQRKETCDPNFRTTGNMTALRNRIRDVIWTSNSCLISEVIEG